MRAIRQLGVFLLGFGLSAGGGCIVLLTLHQAAWPICAVIGGAYVALLGAPLIWLRSSSENPPDTRLDRFAMHSADILGVSHRAPLPTIRAAYLKLVKELHPYGPNVPAGAYEQLQRLNEAYQKLKEYDRLRKTEKPDVSATAALASIWTRVRQVRFSAGRAGRENPTIEAPPGMRLNRFAQLLPKRAYERVLKPCLADMQEEYCAALQAGDERAAQRARFWGVVAFWAAVARLILVEPLIKIALTLRT